MATPLGPFFWNAAMCMGSTSMGSTAAPRPSRRHVESLLFRQQKLPLLLDSLDVLPSRWDSFSTCASVHYLLEQLLRLGQGPAGGGSVSSASNM
jgi:hypothetical protein